MMNYGYYIDYQPSDSNAKNVTYIYKNERNGLRYGRKTFKQFIENNKICITQLKLNKIQNFYDFFMNVVKKENGQNNLLIIILIIVVILLLLL